MKREKPDTSVSDEAWVIFNTLADMENYGIMSEDWMAWFIAFEAGYLARMEE